jgi:hypothetical protein
MLKPSRIGWLVVASVILAGGIFVVASRSYLGESRIPGKSKAILERADEFQLLSLEPRFQRGSKPDDFHGYKVLGAMPIRDAKTRKRFVAAFEKGITQNDGVIAACFNPRHGIIVTRNGQQADFVICFECFQFQVYGVDHGTFSIGDSPRELFNQALRDAQIPLTKEILSRR